MTPLDVSKFQSDPRNVGPFGKPLKADGVLGPQTQWALFWTTQAPERQNICLRAWAHLGLVESAPNEDQAGFIRGWLKAAGVRPGDPWCAAFACACLALPPSSRTAGAVALGQRYPAVPFAAATTGDLVWFRTDDNGHGHVELLLGKDAAAGLALTIGGNVSNGVRLSLRPADRVNFSQTVKDSSGTCPGVIHHRDAPLRIPSYAGTR